MKVLVTGASGFVGSHVVARLRSQQIPTSVLLRSSSNTRFLEEHLQFVGRREGSLDDQKSLSPALKGITHVIHCAGCTRAASSAEFHTVNAVGSRNIAEAVRLAGPIRLIHISSLAAAGPAIPKRPALESDCPNPVSEYGRSKLAGEEYVRGTLQDRCVILRPPAVYGPRDQEFLRLFKAIAHHLRPVPSTQPLSLVYVEDLAAAIVGCLLKPEAAGKTYFVSHPEVVTARQLAENIATAVGHWTLPFPLPTLLFWPLCAGQEILSRFSRKPSVLSLQKYSELRAPGWVCDPSLLRNELGIQCETGIQSGVAQTLKWYRTQKWL